MREGREGRGEEGKDGWEDVRKGIGGSGRGERRVPSSCGSNAPSMVSVVLPSKTGANEGKLGMEKWKRRRTLLFPHVWEDKPCLSY